MSFICPCRSVTVVLRTFLWQTMSMSSQQCMWRCTRMACLVCTASSGPINSWNRQAYLTLDPRTGAARSTVNQVTTNEITRNFIMAGTGESTYPIDHDDCSAHYHDHQ